VSQPPLRVVAALIADAQGRVFAARRPFKGRNGGMWELPGGKVEPGETDEAALARELHEELAVVGTVGPHFHTEFRQIQNLRPLELVVYRASIEGEPQLREHLAFTWVDAATSPTLGWCDVDVPCIHRWFQGRAG
jgi:8-oxo-dGTP diphosphatase